MYTVSIWHPEKTVWIHFECLALPNCFVSHLIKRKSKRNEALFVMNFLVAALGKCFLPPSAARSLFVCQAKTSFQYEKCVQRHTVYTTDTFIECNENRSSSSTYVHSFGCCCCCHFQHHSNVTDAKCWASVLSATAFHSVSIRSLKTSAIHICVRSVYTKQFVVCLVVVAVVVINMIWLVVVFIFITSFWSRWLCFATVAEKAVATVHF